MSLLKAIINPSPSTYLKLMFVMCGKRCSGFPFTYARSKIVPTTWKLDHAFGPAFITNTRIGSPTLHGMGFSAYWLAYPLNTVMFWVPFPIIAA